MATGLRFNTARELFTVFPAVTGDMLAAPTDQTAIDFCRALLAGRTPEEAITFCAYLLPDRTAVWWGHECLSHLEQALDTQDMELLAVVRDWVSEPHERRHHVAMGEASAASQRTPAVWIALAAGWYGNGSANGAQAAVHAARAVNIGILAGLARVALTDRFSVLSAFVEMGIQLAEIEALRARGGGT